MVTLPAPEFFSEKLVVTAAVPEANARNASPADTDPNAKRAPDSFHQVVGKTIRQRYAVDLVRTHVTVPETCVPARGHASVHTDTMTPRIAPRAPKGSGGWIKAALSAHARRG